MLQALAFDQRAASDDDRARGIRRAKGARPAGLEFPSDIELLTTDVFDTLVLRKPRSARSRIVEGEKRFARLLLGMGCQADVDDLIDVRLLAERLAYRALDVTRGPGEVRLVDILARQAAIFGLPAAARDRRLEIEIDIEKLSLSPNRPLAAALRRRREAGLGVAAVSDTALPGDRLAALIDHVCGPGVVDRVYTSADLALTKREGSIFPAVLAAEATPPERAFHVGDDPVADVERPRSIGVRALHLPRARLKSMLSRAHGGMTEALRFLTRRRRRRIASPSDAGDLGRRLLGPIAAEFCLRLWLYASEAEKGGDACLLFCARGGVGMREAFERVVARLGLPLSLPRGNLLVSRLVAARVAVVRRCASVLDELDREFFNGSFAEVAATLGGGAYDLPEAWRQPFRRDAFFALLDSPAGRPVLADMTRQTELFLRHLAQVSGGARRIILCDTGLYGSTQRMLADAIPEFSFEMLHFARCNYKGLSESHFPRLAGLVVESELYNPFQPETCALRYWHLFESLFEPSVPSVRWLEEGADGVVFANCGEVAYGRFDPSAGNLLLKEALAYIDEAPGGAAILRDAAEAWPKLRRLITRPRFSEVAMMDVGVRSRDFGHDDSVQVLRSDGSGGFVGKLKEIKNHLWREGAIARNFPVLGQPLLVVVEALHSARSLKARRSF